MTSSTDINSHWETELKTQTTDGDKPHANAFSCSFCAYPPPTFLLSGQLFDHITANHPNFIEGTIPNAAHACSKKEPLEYKEFIVEAPARSGSEPDITASSLERAEDKALDHTEILRPDYFGDKPRAVVYPEPPGSKIKDHSLFDHSHVTSGIRSSASTTQASSECSVETTGSHLELSRATFSPSNSVYHESQSGFPEIQSYDFSYPGVLLQSDSFPIPRKRLTIEFESINVVTTRALLRKRTHDYVANWRAILGSEGFKFGAAIARACGETSSGEFEKESRLDVEQGRSRMIKTSRQQYIPMSANGSRVEAFPDTGSELDIISHSLSTQLNLKLNKTQVRTIQMPTGRKIQTLGTAELDIAFQGEKSKHRRTFHVLARSVHRMILGKSFLTKTETLTKFAHRIKSRLFNLASKIPRLHLLGSVTERVIGSINGVLTTAVDDTGSDVMVISWNEAVRLGLEITTDHSHRTLLEFVDGEEIYTDGAVLGVDWRFGHDTTGEAIKVDFQVVRDLTCNLILSNQVLFLTNTYNNPDFFLAEELGVPLHDDYASLCVITDRAERKRKLDYLVGWFRSHPEETDVEDSALIARAERVLDEEVARQVYEEERINGLPENERGRAWEEEYKLRREREQAQTTLNSVPPALQHSGSSPATPPASGDPPLQSPSGDGADAPLQPANKQNGWKKYFWSIRLRKRNGGRASVPTWAS